METYPTFRRRTLLPRRIRGQLGRRRSRYFDLRAVMFWLRIHV